MYFRNLLIIPLNMVNKGIVIAKIEKLGISNIFAVPLDNPPEELKLFDSIHRSDGSFLINKGMFLAVIFSVIAASRGVIRVGTYLLGINWCSFWLLSWYFN